MDNENMKEICVQGDSHEKQNNKLSSKETFTTLHKSLVRTNSSRMKLKSSWTHMQLAAVAKASSVLHALGC